MSNRRFEMYEYLLVINQLRQGATLRGLAREQIADRKKLRKIRDVALSKGWLEQDKPLPTEEALSLVFKKSFSEGVPRIAPYRVKIRPWGAME